MNFFGLLLAIVCLNCVSCFTVPGPWSASPKHSAFATESKFACKANRFGIPQFGGLMKTRAAVESSPQTTIKYKTLELKTDKGVIWAIHTNAL